MAGDGRLTVYMPGMQPDHVRSESISATPSGTTWRCTSSRRECGCMCDGKQVADQAVKSQGKAVVPGGLAFGRLVEGGHRLRRRARLRAARRGTASIQSPSRELPAVDDDTLGLWQFGQRTSRPKISRSRRIRRRLRRRPSPAPAAEPPPGQSICRPADPRLKAVLIDRSPNDAYLAVKADSMGRLFVGGREAVFVFEPDGTGRLRAAARAAAVSARLDHHRPRDSRRRPVRA